MKASLSILFLILIPGLALGQAGVNNTPNRKKPAVRRHNWTAFYGGGIMGYGLVGAETSFNPLPDAATFISLQPTTLSPPTTSGFVAGALLGCNFQMADWVSGLEADFQTGPGAALSQSPIIDNNGNLYPGSGFLQTVEKTDWFGTARARLGFNPVGRLLVYLTGGLAYGSVNYSASTDFRPAGANFYSVSYGKIKMGWTAGGGAEWMLDRFWSLKAEDLYYDLGDESALADAGPVLDPPYQVSYHWKTTANVFRVGLNYKFF